MKDQAHARNAVVVGEDTPGWSGTWRQERPKACAAHAAARCCRHGSFANPGRWRLTVAYVVLGTADEGDRPWVTPVFYAADGEYGQRSFKQGVTMHRYAICDVSEASPC
jgi:hypothetical protein